MKRLIVLAKFAICMSLLTGCKVPREDGPFDKEWRAGYGFNNPNVDRARKGLPPLNFDGSVHRP